MKQHHKVWLGSVRGRSNIEQALQRLKLSFLLVSLLQRIIFLLAIYSNYKSKSIIKIISSNHSPVQTVEKQYQANPIYPNINKQQNVGTPKSLDDVMPSSSIPLISINEIDVLNKSLDLLNFNKLLLKFNSSPKTRHPNTEPQKNYLKRK